MWYWCVICDEEGCFSLLNGMAHLSENNTEKKTLFAAFQQKILTTVTPKAAKNRQKELSEQEHSKFVSVN